MNDTLCLTVLAAINSYQENRPATNSDLWMMAKVRSELVLVAGIFNAKRQLAIVLQSLRKSGAIKYSRKPAGWVVA